MLSGISWSCFDGKKFQEFCNALLLFTVSKKAKVYSKPGRDKGIDQLFEGVFEGTHGKWRFQDKFHEGKEGDEKYLKRIIAKDIENLEDEDGIIYITNASLLPQQEQRILKASATEIAKKTKRTIIIEIWHHGKIEAKLKEAPLVFYWYWQPEHISLQEYNQHFSYELDQTNEDLPNQFHKTFIGRESDLSSLSDFLSSQRFVATGITGEGGAGKTRLVVEFFKRYIANSDDYIALVARDNFRANTNLEQLLSSTRLKYVILVDDAQNKVDTLSWINRFALNNRGRVKVVFTTRGTLYSETISKIPSHEQNIASKAELAPLSKQETYEIVKSILSKKYPEHDITRLTMVSRGNPAIILALCQQVLHGKNFHQVIKEDSFNESVRQIVKEIADDISRVRGFAREKIIKIINILAVAGPIEDSVENRITIASLATIEQLDFENVVMDLRAKHFLDLYGPLAIRLEPYSESIFASIATTANQINNWMALNLTHEMRVNFLRNLVIANAINNNKSNHEDSLLYEFLTQIKGYDMSYQTLKGIIDSIRQISLIKPDIGAYCVKMFTEIFLDQNHPLHNQGKKSWLKPEIEVLAESIETIIKNILVATNEDHKVSERIGVLIAYAKASKRHDIISASFGFTIYDWEPYRFGYRTGFIRQKFIAAKLKDWIMGDDEILSSQGIKLAKYLLETDYRGDGFYNPVTSSISILSWQIIDIPIFHELRHHALLALFTLIEDGDRNRSKKEAIREICRVLFFIVKNHNSRYDHDEELKLVIGFIEENLSKEQGNGIKLELFGFMQIFTRKEIKEEYEVVYNRLLEKVTCAKTSKEKLLLLVHQKYISLDAESFERDRDEWLSSYKNPHDIIIDLLEVRPAVDPGWHMNFDHLVASLAKMFPQESRIWFSEIVDSGSEYIPDFIGLLTVNFSDEEYFYEQIDLLWKKESGKYWNILLWALTAGRMRKKENYRLKDLDYFEEAAHKGIQPIHTIRLDLPMYVWIDSDRTFDLIARIMDDNPRLHHNSILSWIFYSYSDIVENFKIEIKELIIRHTYTENLSDHDMQKALYFLENQFGFDTLFDYVKDRLNHFVTYGGEYMSFINLGDSYNNPLTSPEKSIDNYIKVLNWYIMDENPKHFLNEYVLRYFLPRTSFGEHFNKRFKDFVEKNKTARALAKVADAFIEINQKTTEFIELITWVANEYIGLDRDADDKLLFSLFFRHIMFGDGVKSGHPSSPFPSDIAKRDLLKEFVSNHLNEMNPTILRLLRDCLDQVEGDIEQDVIRGREFDHDYF